MTHCIECGGVLKEKLDDGQWPERRRPEEGEADAGLPPGIDYQKLVIVPPSTAAALMPSFLEAGIPIKVEPSPHGLRLSARAQDRSAAMSILEEEGVLPRQPDHSEPAVAAEGGPCPACGQAVRPGTSECPECGLALTGEAGCESCGEPLAPNDPSAPPAGSLSHTRRPNEPDRRRPRPSSGLPVSVTASGSCTVSGDELTLTGGGLCTLTASQIGDERFGPAEEVSQSFHVLFDFTGFLRPVLNPPVVNRVNAGRTVPIRFSLGGAQARDVVAEGSPSVRPVPCDASAPVNDIRGMAPKRSSSLRYSAKYDRYTVLWKTDKSFAGTCQEQSLELIDGSVHRATFRFTAPHPCLRPRIA